MAVHEKRVRGLIFLKIDGNQIAVRGDVVYKLSSFQNQTYANLDNSMSIGGTPQLGYIECTINNYQNTDIMDLMGKEGVTVTIEPGNGKIITAKDAVQVGECEVNAEEGTFSIRFESDSVQEVPA